MLTHRFWSVEHRFDDVAGGGGGGGAADAGEGGGPEGGGGGERELRQAPAGCTMVSPGAIARSSVAGVAWRPGRRTRTSPSRTTRAGPGTATAPGRSPAAS